MTRSKDITTVVLITAAAMVTAKIVHDLIVYVLFP